MSDVPSALSRVPAWTLRGLPVLAGCARPLAALVAFLIAAFATVQAQEPEESDLPRILRNEGIAARPLPSAVERYTGSRQDRLLTADTIERLQRNESPGIVGWRRWVSSLERLDRAAQVTQVNDWVNRSLTYREDCAVGHRKDDWAGVPEALLRRAGDCEEYALVKLASFHALGWDMEDLAIVVGQIFSGGRNVGHALAAVRLNDQILLLDSLSDAVLTFGQRRYSFDPMEMINAAGQGWVLSQTE